ncbi:chemotaxis protein CheW [Clostridium saccharobutylicum]|uniref:Putative CheW protein n=1 Tax=Clostridium saccharobutylicum DSM 13864 TaxID=1345695 RepID=U5MW09_CLOSA|nr:chemotaxis protein CheW [Clostridium saccharobutylicum]AGX44944.1 putative CheW protein [Clostridium saccharobutylicum DSM 13864]AQR92226.1 chemotaxis protein CheW [Clostridium saccharobutylicum]AQS02128.1 chemotaxis protein CheW [Clostridium saccharobutylicum]AQS11732.1 chemotaxis protein CheW [Clostridium saccharobutylicum]AQS16111.1 chemotaxis protein CheW [Clostridium saccharobutylicum]
MASNDVKMLIFGLNGEHYATDIKEVERILGYQEPTILPESPVFVKGVINYEQSILPIISLSRKFKLGEDKEDENRKIIVIKREEKKFGIIVENVYEVRDVNSDSIEVTPSITSTIEREYINGLIKLEDNIVISLDLEKILSSEDEDKIF